MPKKVRPQLVYKVEPELGLVEGMNFGISGKNTEFALEIQGIKANIYIMEQ